MANLSLNHNQINPFSFFSTYQASQNTETEAIFSADQFSLTDRVSTLFTRIYGVISGVFLLTNVVGIVSASREIIYGPIEGIRRKYQSRFTQVRLGADLGRNLGSAGANMLRVAAVVRSFFCSGGVWCTYASLNIVANCFSIFASGCEIVSNIHSIKHINSLLGCKTPSIKKDFLLHHRQSSIFSIALAVGNIAMSVLFSLSVVLGLPLVMGISGVVCILMIPVLCVAMKQKSQVFSRHAGQNDCCKVFN
jgi:hypothetical protein